MHLGSWAGSPGPGAALGQVRGHVVCVLCVRLRWTCSLCGGLFRQVRPGLGRLGSAPVGSLTAASLSVLLQLRVPLRLGRLSVPSQVRAGAGSEGGGASPAQPDASLLPRLVLDDGTGEAHVWLSGAQVRPALGLSASQWEGLQRALRPRGQVEVLPWGKNLVRPRPV